MGRTLKGAKVLVTGGAGFIGSSLVRLLAESNAEVLTVDNLANGKRENVVDESRVTLLEADIRDSHAMEQLLAGVDIVYHLACLGVRHSIHSPIENHQVNADATLRLLELSRQAGVGRFVYVSSSEVYGTTRFVPMTEDHPTLTKTVYGASKLAGESYARAYWETYRYPTVVLRPFNAFGPRCHHEGDSGEVIPKFMLRALAGLPLIVFGDGSQSRDFTYVTDTARAILRAGIADAAVGETINIGNSNEVAIKDLARIVAEVVGRPDATVVHEAPRPGDVLRLHSHAGKAKQLLDFEPSVGLVDGLKLLHAWYNSAAVPVEQLLQQEKVHNWERPL